LALASSWCKLVDLGDFGRNPIQLTGPFLAYLFPAFGLGLNFCRFDHDLLRFKLPDYS